MFGKPAASGASEMLLRTIRRPVTSRRCWLTATKRSRRWKKSPRLKNEPLKENWNGICEKPAVPTGVAPGTVAVAGAVEGEGEGEGEGEAAGAGAEAEPPAPLPT